MRGSEFAPMASVLMPRMFGRASEPERPTDRPGARSCSRVISVMLFFSIVSAFSAVIASGTSCSRSATRCAVTIMSPTAASSAGDCAIAGCTEKATMASASVLAVRVNGNMRILVIVDLPNMRLWPDQMLCPVVTLCNRSQNFTADCGIWVAASELAMLNFVEFPAHIGSCVPLHSTPFFGGKGGDDQWQRRL